MHHRHSAGATRLERAYLRADRAKGSYGVGMSKDKQKRETKKPKKSAVKAATPAPRPIIPPSPRA